MICIVCIPDLLFRAGESVRFLMLHPFSRWPVLGLPCMFMLMGCISLHAPLLKDRDYPSDWPDIAPAGEECKGLAGTYWNSGDFAPARATGKGIFLSHVLALSADGGDVSISIHTRRLDKNGDAFSTLVVSLDGDRQNSRELANCFCIKQTLTCTQINEKYWSIPNFGVGGSQSNVYISGSTDGSLIVKLQDYHADFVLGLPMYGGKDTWVRFKPVRQ